MQRITIQGSLYIHVGLYIHVCACEYVKYLIYDVIGLWKHKLFRFVSFQAFCNTSVK